MLAVHSAFVSTPNEAEAELKQLVAAARAKGASQEDIIKALSKVQADIVLEHQGKVPAPQSHGFFSSLFGSKSPAPAPAPDTKTASAAKSEAKKPAAPVSAPAPAAASAEAPAPSGNAKQGAAIFKAKCATCHTCTDGGPQKQGPNLYGVVGRQSGVKAGFNFTKALKEKNVEWTSENLLSFLQAPKGFAKGTSMAFPGFKKECDRADVVAYLNTLK